MYAIQVLSALRKTATLAYNPLAFLLISGFCLLPHFTQAQFAINGTATQLSADCYRLTEAVNSSSGSVWSEEKVDITRAFDLRAEIYLGTKDGNGADGMTFVLQPISNNIGVSGGGIGYGGISPSFAVEFDTWSNGNNADPFYDHIAITRNGVLNHVSQDNLAGPVRILAGVDNVEDGRTLKVRFTWDPSSNEVAVYVDCALRLTATIDLVNDIFNGDPAVFWGFTSATGGANNEHRFCLDYVSFTEATWDTLTTCRNASITLGGSNATGSTYLWTPSTGLSDSTVANPIASLMATSTYYLETTDTCGLTRFDTVTVVVSDSLVAVDAGADQSICPGETTQLSGTGEGTLRWEPVNLLNDSLIANPVVSPLDTTTFILTATRTDGCSSSDTVIILVLPGPVADAGPDASYCEGGQTLLSASGGQSYTWSPTAGLSNPNIASPTLSETPGGWYRVEVTDSQNCTNTDSVFITVHPLPDVDAGPDTSVCIGESIRLSGRGLLNLEWQPASLFTQNTIPNPQVSLIQSQTLILTVTDQSLCSNQDSVNITVNPIPVLSATADQLICAGDSALLNVNGAETYTWFPDVGLSESDASRVMASPNSDTQYMVIGVDQNNCQDSANVLVSLKDKPVALGPDSLTLCPDDPFTLSVSGGDTFLWNTGETTSSIASNLTSSPSLFWVIPFLDNCPGDTAFSEVRFHDYLAKADFTLNTERAPYPATIQAIDLSQHATSYQWQFGEGSSSTETNPRNIYATPGTYLIQLLVEDNNGCLDSAEQQIEILNRNLFTPNAFTPNGDGKNDRFFISIGMMSSFEIAIFDQWGEQVFQSNDIDFSWDGTHSGNSLPEGTYSFLIRGTTVEGVPIVRPGTINMFR
ncbi:MAG: gliding motility-associated C-terminal domain-containing protein [Bacteroidota bacterium]